MFSLIGLPGLLKAYAWVAAVVAAVKFVASHVLFGELPDAASGYLNTSLDAFGTGILVASMLVWGCQTALFPWACRRTPLGRLFPPIDGEWRGTLDSNFALIAQRDPELRSMVFEPQPTEARLLIKARLLAVSINLKSRALNSDAPYLESDTLIVGVTREGTDQHLRLTYVFQARARLHLPSDSDMHHGAAVLDMEVSSQEQVLRGTYWTDRNWQQARNTAGNARFARSHPGKPFVAVRI